MPAVLFPLELHRRRKGGYKIENNQKYNIIYADPPWRYQQKSLSGAAEHHYPTMSVKDICELKVEEIAAKDCVLFLWATFPQLPEALHVIKAWGFQYKTLAFVWLKQNKSGKGWFFGLGFWARGNAEITAPKFQPCPSVSDQSNPRTQPKARRSKRENRRAYGGLTPCGIICP